MMWIIFITMFARVVFKMMQHCANFHCKFEQDLNYNFIFMNPETFRNFLFNCCFFWTSSATLDIFRFQYGFVFLY